MGEEVDIQVAGTVGILLSALEKGYLDLHKFTELVNLLRSDATTCYLSEAMARSAIADAEERTMDTLRK